VRGNGLTAASYTAVADVEPHLADALLGLLRDERVAAYAGRSPERPETDRVYVDAASAARAREILAAHLPGLVDHVDPDPDDVEAAFLGIVAGFDAGSPEEVPPWPTTEDLDLPPGPPSTAEGRVLRAATGWDDLFDEEPDEAATAEPPSPDDHYVPPPPPPLPAADAGTRLAWAGAIGGPLLIFVSAILGWRLDGWLLLLAAAGFVGGFVALVARLKDDPDDDPHGGAVV